jgi:hypothetical protein
MPMSKRPTSGRGTDTHSTALVGLWADVDYDAPGHKRNPDGLPLPPTITEAQLILDSIPMRPTLTLATGGGLQAWWILDEPEIATTDAEQARLHELVKSWGSSMVEHGRRLGWHVDAVGDPSRVLRVPGTWRTKHHNGIVLDPIRVTLHHVEHWPVGIAGQRPWIPGGRYDVSELAAAIIETQPAPRPRATSPARAPANRDPSDGFGPADAFALLSWAEILEPAGWTFVGHERDAELWLRPGDPSSEYSLKAWPGAAVVWSDSAGLPVGPGQRLTRFRLWCELRGLTESEGGRLVRGEQRRLAS